MPRSALVWLLLILGVLTALAILFARPLTRLITPGFVDNPPLFDLTVDLTRIVFPYIIEISVVALCMMPPDPSHRGRGTGGNDSPRRVQGSALV